MSGAKKKRWSQADEDGDLLYFSGRVCPKGHNGLRYVSSRQCVTCGRASVAAYNRARAARRKARRDSSRDRALEIIRGAQ